MNVFNYSGSSACYSATNVKFDILVNNRSVKQFPHKGKVYIEGREKSNYSIRVKNDNSHEILAVISVDGLSVIDGTPASENSRGWIVNGNSEIVIPGWLVNRATAAKFQFAEKKSSYAANTEEGDINNTGVIGCIVYEKKNTVVYRDYYDYDKFTPRTPINPWRGPFDQTPGWNGNWGDNIVYGGGAGYGYGSGSGVLRGSSLSNNLDSVKCCATACLNDTSSPELGTGFGKKTEFASKTSEFERGSLLTSFVLYYNSKKNLEKLGIVFEKKKKDIKEPNPFPASKNFCKPPKNW